MMEGLKSSKACLVSQLCVQILQSIANHVLFTKEEHMRPFNDYVKSNFEAARKYARTLADLSADM